MANIKKWLGKPKMATLQVPAVIKDAVMAFALRLDKSCPQAVKYAADALDDIPDQVEKVSTFVVKVHLPEDGESHRTLAGRLDLWVRCGNALNLSPVYELRIPVSSEWGVSSRGTVWLDCF